MNKYETLSENKNDFEDDKEIYPFSFFQFFLKVIVILNIIISLFLIYDYFMPPLTTEAKCGFVSNSQLEVNFPNGGYDNILIDRTMAKEIKSGETIKYYSTPIFNHNKYLIIDLANNSKLKINNYDIGFVLLFIITNTLAFVLLILFPSFFDKWAKNYDDSIMSFFIKPYNYFKYSYVMLLLTGVPIIMGLYYMFELYKYFTY